MDTKRWWTLFVDLAAVVWMGLFVVDVAATYGVVDLSSTEATLVGRGLLALILVFLLDIALLYRWSEQGARAFVRSNWLLIAAAIPWFRPLRLLRVGRGVRALRLMARSRKVGSFLNKIRRMLERYWHRLRE
ncbi:hypothetical protein [Natrinema sp. 1APR25-10V2]|uniref:hypothetical protein n=1 Tax=Natrinema sp. 1APR25-10V2 TaxID=2951081 RepID=UPI002876A20D|nr:hypothetical protein [Natrinema sp. 1APR25-10V2]MDS0473417.1 hypothetical protein [Natrinema sp. 1APR25-10V2]